MTTQLVFVHGVATRLDDAYRHAVRQRDQMFQHLVFDHSANIANPYWGDLGACPPDGGWRSLPGSEPDVTPLARNPWSAADGQTIARAMDPIMGPQGLEIGLAERAVRDLASTVDLIFAQIFDDHAARGVTLPTGLIEIADQAVRWGMIEPSPTWLHRSLNDERVLDHIAAAIDQAIGKSGMILSGPPFASQDLLSDAFRRIINKTRAAGGRWLMRDRRSGYHDRMIRFIGDVMIYLKDGPKRDAIRTRIARSIRPAVTSGNPVVLMGHSMGGVILADCLMDEDFRRSVGLIGNTKIDALITVGSQPGLFQELGLLSGANDDPNGPVIPNLRGWLNIYDALDILSYRAGRIFPQATDLAFANETGLLSAHSAYFNRIGFYSRLKARLPIQRI